MERMAHRAQTVVVDSFLAALAFSLAFMMAPTQPNFGLDRVASPDVLQLTALYGALAGVFALAFRRELSPWRYVSIPDTLVLARIALFTVGVFLLADFVLDRGEDVPRSALLMAPLFQMVGSMGVRIVRRALHERALESLSPVKAAGDRGAQAPSLLLIGPPSLADTYLRDVARSHDRSYTPVGIVGTDRRDVGQQVRGVCIIDAIDRLD